MSRRRVAPVVGGLLLALGATAPAGAQPRPLPHDPRAALGLSAGPSAERAGLASPGPRDPGRRVRLAVTLAPGAHPGEVATAAVRAGGSLAHRLDQLHALSLSVPAPAAAAIMRSLARRADVVEVSPVLVRHAMVDPDDTYYGNQQPYLSAINAPAAWGITHGAATIKVAVIDSGVDVLHPDLVGKVADAHNAMATAASTTDVTDEVGHGTHVAGVVAAASNNGTGITGTGYDTSLLAVKAGDETGFSDDDLAAGITWATNSGARVINLSLGGSGSSPMLSDAVSYAQSHGVLVVAAAGNEGRHPNPAVRILRNYPAAYAGVISVGATDAIGHRAAFSTFGSWVTVAAPGTAIWSTVPTAGSAVAPAPTSGYAALDGTSMAAPIVAGEAALLLAHAPFATAAQVRSAVVGSAHGYGGLGLGTGQVDLGAAFGRMPPTTIPSIASPASAALVAGGVTVAASTTGAAAVTSVQFLLDGTPLGPRTPVSTGTAGMTWESWGASNGLHALTAQACNAYGCGPLSDATEVTVQNAPPSITSPTGGSTVGGVAHLVVTTTDAAPKTQVKVDGLPLGAPVAVTGGTAEVVWPTGGFADGAHSITAASCTSAGACGSASSTSLSVSNAAPVLTSPKVGQLVSGPLTLTATADSGALQFLVDGKQVGFDATSPYSVVVNFSGQTDGTHVLQVKPCTASTSLCAGPSTSRSITVKSLHPSLTSAVPSAFSPNGDKRADTTTLHYSLPDTESVWWGVKNSAGAVVRGPYYAGTLAKGPHQFLWNGNLANGTRAPSGSYTAYVSTKDLTSSPTHYGQASRVVRVDTVAPTLTVTGPATGFYPYSDGYRDTVLAKATVNEPGLLTLTARNSRGSVVRTVSVNHSGTGSYNLTWNGRDSAGHLVPTGTYRVQVTAQDVALNRRASTTYSVVVSLKRLVGTSVTKVVTPAQTQAGYSIGSCSQIFENPTPGWAGAFDYVSGYYFYRDDACPDPADDWSDLVTSNHQLTLPAAVTYSGLSVTATGREYDAGYGDEAYGWYRDPTGKAVGGATLGPEYYAYSLRSAASSLLYGGRTLRWSVGTYRGQIYTVRAFTVRYTYHVLV